MLRKVISVSAVTAIALTACSANAPEEKVQTWPQKAYTAHYTRTNAQNPKGYSQTEYSDGAGLKRFEWKNPIFPSLLVKIVDYRGDKWYSISEDPKEVREGSPLRFVDLHFNDGTAKKYNLEVLGARNLDGYAVHGWRGANEYQVEEVWTDDVTGAYVESTTTSSGTTTTMKLDKLEVGPVESKLFVVPQYRRR